MTKYEIENKAEEYSTGRHGYSNENHQKYLDDKQTFLDGYYKALEDLKEEFQKLTTKN